jgi:hypothetical protein
LKVQLHPCSLSAMKKTIQITCKAAVTMDLADLQPLQGNLKELAVANFEKLKRSILKHGVSFPFFVWQHDGINYVLDGHQRDRVLRKMQEQGYEVPQRARPLTS